LWSNFWMKIFAQILDRIFGLQFWPNIWLKILAQYLA
jgi:hypothetical protein